MLFANMFRSIGWDLLISKGLNNGTDLRFTTSHDAVQNDLLNY
jgi:hypothetical protein